MAGRTTPCSLCSLQSVYFTNPSLGPSLIFLLLRPGRLSINFQDSSGEPSTPKRLQNTHTQSCLLTPKHHNSSSVIFDDTAGNFALLTPRLDTSSYRSPSTPAMRAAPTIDGGLPCFRLAEQISEMNGRFQPVVPRHQRKTCSIKGFRSVPLAQDLRQPNNPLSNSATIVCLISLLRWRW